MKYKKGDKKGWITLSQDTILKKSSVLLKNGLTTLCDRDIYRIFVQLNGSKRAERDMTLPDFAGEELDI